MAKHVLRYDPANQPPAGLRSELASALPADLAGDLRANRVRVVVSVEPVPPGPPRRRKPAAAQPSAQPDSGVLLEQLRAAALESREAFTAAARPLRRAALVAVAEGLGIQGAASRQTVHLARAIHMRLTFSRDFRAIAGLGKPTGSDHG